MQMATEIQQHESEVEAVTTGLNDQESDLRKLKKSTDEIDPREKFDKQRSLEAEIRDLQRELASKQKDFAKARLDLDLQLRKDNHMLFRMHEKVSNAIFQVCMSIILSGGAMEFVEILNCVKDLFQQNISPHLAMMNDVVKAVLDGREISGCRSIQ